MSHNRGAISVNSAPSTTRTITPFVRQQGPSMNAESSNLTKVNPDRNYSHWSDLTSEKDIYYCFRLILGRNPGSDEWRYHQARLGAELSSTVRSYLGSAEFSKRGMFSHELDLKDIRIADVNGASLYVNEQDPVIGRSVLSGNYEPDVVAVFKRYLRPGMRIIDIGANIGFYTILSTVLVGGNGHVLAVEPNPSNTKLLEASRLKNNFDNIEVAQVAASDHTGLLILNAGESNGTTSKADSDTGVLEARSIVPCMKLDTLVDPNTSIDFVKIDVEGAEYLALCGLKETILRCKPIIVSEFSPKSLPAFSGCGAVDYLAFFVNLGYKLGVITRDGSITECGTDTAAVMEAFYARHSDHIDIVAEPTLG